MRKLYDVHADPISGQTPARSGESDQRSSVHVWIGRVIEACVCMCRFDVQFNLGLHRVGTGIRHIHTSDL
jgi:hypothetical protein